jgi:large subunit ribosomal protein L14
MISKETMLNVLDNSGALTVKCFHIYGKSKAIVGSKIVISVKTFRTGKKVKKGEVYKGVIVSTKYPQKRNFGSYLSSGLNGVVLWKRKEDSPVGSRVSSFVPLELRFNGFLKIILISYGVY